MNNEPKMKAGPLFAVQWLVPAVIWFCGYPTHAWVFFVAFMAGACMVAWINIPLEEYLRSELKKER